MACAADDSRQDRSRHHQQENRADRQRETTVALDGKCDWALVNEGGHGFYRVNYAPALLQAITHNLGELKPIERFGLVSDTWAATVAGLSPLSEFLKMARLFTNETDINAWRALMGAFNYLDMIVDEKRSSRASRRKFAESSARRSRDWDGSRSPATTN